MALFEKILIANRGEIACRIIKTAKKLGIKAITIYSENDIDDLHVKLADEAFLVPNTHMSAYLNAEKIIEIAVQAHIQAIHPGYGFLSENANFAKSCEKAGIRYIGPSAEVIQLMGEKHIAKTKMLEQGIPVLSGYYDENQDEELLLKTAQKIGFPILIKAVAGGGGKGLRLVEEIKEFKHQLAAAKREAKSSFGDSRILLEKYLPNPRHVEVQVIADNFGNTISLFERDCSIQRRHQKIIEEAPAPNLSAKLRKQLNEAGVTGAKAIGYRNAGTMEFLVTEDEQFYFMEMNTRLQVEHPVTEMITGIDIVEWQIRIAADEPLPLKQLKDSNPHGHAFEARICAENPEKDFIPSSGNLFYFKMPEANATTRIDSGYQQGDNVSIYYDSLIAKLIVWSEDRELALMHLDRALDQCEIAGVKTNVSLLKAIISHSDFKAGNINTHFLIKHSDLLTTTNHGISPFAVLFATLTCIHHEQNLIAEAVNASSDSNSPWFKRDVWQLNLAHQQLFRFKYDNHEILVTVKHLANQVYEIEINQAVFTVALLNIQYLEPAYKLELQINSRTEFATVVIYKHINVFFEGKHYLLEQNELIHQSMSHLSETGHLLAPMPGTVVALLVDSGQKVNKGDKLMVIEAMKMEHTIYAPYNGVVKECFYHIGDLIDEGAELLEINQESP